MFENVEPRKLRTLVTALGASGLIGIAIVLLVSHVSNSTLTDRKSMLTIGAAAHQWQVFYGDNVCPSVRQLVQSKYLDPNVPKLDPWGQPFSITCLEFEIVVTSLGPDRKSETKDDILVSSRRHP